MVLFFVDWIKTPDALDNMSREISLVECASNYWEQENDEECLECASKKDEAAFITTIVNSSNASSNTTNTTVSAPSCYLTYRIGDMSKRDLETLHKNIEED